MLVQCLVRFLQLLVTRTVPPRTSRPILPLPSWLPGDLGWSALHHPDCLQRGVRRIRDPDPSSSGVPQGLDDTWCHLLAGG